MIRYTEFNSCLNVGFLIQTVEQFFELEKEFSQMIEDFKDDFMLSCTFKSSDLAERFNSDLELPEETILFYDDKEILQGSSEGFEDLRASNLSNFKKDKKDELLSSFVMVEKTSPRCPNKTKRVRKLSEDFFELADDFDF